MKKSYKVILFNINDAAAAGDRFPEPALGLGYLKSYFDAYSPIAKKVDIIIQKQDIRDTLRRVNPDIIGISSVTQDYTNAVAFARSIKDAGSPAKIIIGGIHISSLPESFNEVFDLGILGEGEETFKEVVEQFYEYGFDNDKKSQIKGIVFRQGQKMVITQRRDLISDLDLIPAPYRKYLRSNTFLHILTARGCPFRCSYCASTAFWGYKVRFHSAGRIVDEMMELIRDYKLRHISIWDDLFSINKQRLAEIAGLVAKNAAVFRNVSFGVTARPNVVDEELCGLLKAMHVKRVSLGIESGSQRMLAALNRGLTVEQNYNAVRTLKKHGFIVNGGFIVGSPGETMQDLNQTYEFVRNSALDGGGIGFALPYPNTEFWRYAREKNLVSENMDFSTLLLIQDPSGLKPSDDFLLLSDKVQRGEFLSIAAKIQRLFAKKNTASLFTLRNFNLRNILIVLENPRVFYNFIASTFKRFFSSIFIRDKNDRLH